MTRQKEQLKKVPKAKINMEKRRKKVQQKGNEEKSFRITKKRESPDDFGLKLSFL